MSGLGSGFVNLFKSWGRGIGNAADNFLLGADARKAISDEAIKKFQPMIERAQRAESRRAANIKDLDNKLDESKKALQDAQNKWQQDYDSALAGAKNQRQTDINTYNAELKRYQDALDNAKRGKQGILDQLYDSEANYNPSRTMFTDVNTGENYIFNPFNGGYISLNSLSKKEKKEFLKNYGNFDTRLFDSKSGNVINAFDKSSRSNYKGNVYFNNYYSNRISTQNAALRDAEKQIKQANGDLQNWNSNNSQPQAWNDSVDLKPFKTTYEKTNGKLPKEYSFNGQNYSKESDLDAAYQKALNHAQYKRDYFRTKASNYASERDKEIAQRIQDAKDIKKAKLALGGVLGAGALYAGARAMYGGDDTPDNTDNIDNTNNIDNTDNTYTGEPDPDFNVEKEGQAILKDRQQIDTGFDPDKAEAKAVLAGAAYDKGVEDGNSIKSSDIVTADGQSIDDGLFELLKAMKDPYKADAVANYIYSKHGNESDVQNLGWRGWLNKYYGDLLRSKMNIDPSGYKGMHISGGL